MGQPSRATTPCLGTFQVRSNGGYGGAAVCRFRCLLLLVHSAPSHSLRPALCPVGAAETASLTRHPLWRGLSTGYRPLRLQLRLLWCPLRYRLFTRLLLVLAAGRRLCRLHVSRALTAR